MNNRAYSFSYTPMTEQEINEMREFPLLEKGIYNFQVIKSELKMSNTGKYHNPAKECNPMISLQLLVWGNDGKEYTVFDNLIAKSTMEWKTRHFCECVGLIKEYDSKTFNETLCEGRSGKVAITIQKGTERPDGSFYKDKNSVENYVIDLFDTTKQKVNDDFKDDDTIPF